MLMLDLFRGHCTDVVKAHLVKSIDLMVIPGGWTAMLQPLDVRLNKPLKAHMKRVYTQWMADGLCTLTPTGLVQRPDIALLSQWIIDAWSTILADMVHKSFRKCATSNSLDGPEDDIFKSSNEALDNSSVAAGIEQYNRDNQ